MEIIILNTPADVADYTAAMFAEQIHQKPDSVLGLATGNSPVAVYDKLIAMNQSGNVSFSQCISFNLDEYIGLQGGHPQSYRYFMNDKLFNHNRY